MLSIIDHNILKSILIYQAVLEYLNNTEFVSNMTADEKESFQNIILECFKTCKDYNGEEGDLKKGCKFILQSKDEISRFYPEIKELT